VDKQTQDQGAAPLKIEDGGQAFPRGGYEGEIYHGESVDGMTLRDYFAAKALAGILASGLDHIDGGGDNSDWRRFSALAYRYADAMIAARHPQSPASPQEGK
jgi:hypothetical protein